MTIVKVSDDSSFSQDAVSKIQPSVSEFTHLIIGVSHLTELSCKGFNVRRRRSTAADLGVGYIGPGYIDFVELVEPLL